MSTCINCNLKAAVFYSQCAECFFSDPQWRFKERVKRLLDQQKVETQEEAEEIVKKVILEKEQAPGQLPG